MVNNNHYKITIECSSFQTEVQKSSLKKCTLNLLADIDDDGLAHSDDDLNTEQLLEKYSYIPNTSTNDPDYIPEEEEPKSEVNTSSSEGTSDAEGNQESPKVNGNGHLKLSKLQLFLNINKVFQLTNYCLYL